MSRTTPAEFAAALPVKTDDPYHRVQVLAERRATRNGHPDPPRAGREAMALRKTLIELFDGEPNVETILQTVAGEYRKKA